MQYQMVLEQKLLEAFIECQLYVYVCVCRHNYNYGDEKCDICMHMRLTITSVSKS